MAFTLENDRADATVRKHANAALARRHSPVRKSKWVVPNGIVASKLHKCNITKDCISAGQNETAGIAPQGQTVSSRGWNARKQSEKVHWPSRGPAPAGSTPLGSMQLLGRCCPQVETCGYSQKAPSGPADSCPPGLRRSPVPNGLVFVCISSHSAKRSWATLAWTNLSRTCGDDDHRHRHQHWKTAVYSKSKAKGTDAWPARRRMLAVGRCQAAPLPARVRIEHPFALSHRVEPQQHVAQLHEALAAALIAIARLAIGRVAHLKQHARKTGLRACRPPRQRHRGRQ